MKQNTGNPPEGFRLKDPYELELWNGKTVTVTDDIEEDPASERPEKRTSISEQVNYLIGFIETFKNNMTPEQITNFVKFMIGSIIGGDSEKFEELLETIETAKQTELEEAESAIAENPEAVYSDLTHNGYMILCRVLNELKTLPEEIRKEELKNRAFRYPDYNIFLSSRPVSLLTGDKEKGMKSRVEYGSEPMEVRVSNRKAKKLVTASIGTFYFIDNRKFPRYLTRFDKQVFNAVCSIHESGYRFFTVANVAEVMIGKNTHYKKTLNRIQESINKMMFSSLELNAKDWLEMKRVFNTNLNYYNGVLLPVEFFGFNSDGKNVAGITQNGQDVECYQFTNYIRLLQVSKAVNELFSIPRHVLQLPININEKVLTLRDFLIERIEPMRNRNGKNKLSNKILFSSIYDAVCSEEKAKTQLNRIREQTFSILNYWAETPSLKDLEELQKTRKLEAWEQNRIDLLKGGMKPINYIHGYSIERKAKGEFTSIIIHL